VKPPSGYRYRNLDAAKRMRDTIATHQAVLSRDELFAGRYVAIRISDGGSDGVAYDSRSDAVEHQRHDAARHGYWRIPIERWDAETCDTLLWYVRAAYDSGQRQDPAHQLIVPTRVEDVVRDMASVYGPDFADAVVNEAVGELHAEGAL
jgi:hypothetical protein